MNVDNFHENYNSVRTFGTSVIFIVRGGERLTLVIYNTLGPNAKISITSTTTLSLQCFSSCTTALVLHIVIYFPCAAHPLVQRHHQYY